jgi:hypothetical protein
MLALYYLVLLALTAIKQLFACRAAALERKFARLAQEVSTLLQGAFYKEGNSSKQDPYQLAKRQYLLGALVQKKDRLEAKHYGWAHRVDRLARLAARLRAWKGRLVPYALGVLDVVAALCLVDYLTQGELVHLQRLVSLLTVKA